MKLSVAKKMPAFERLSPEGKSEFDGLYSQTSRLSKSLEEQTYQVSDSLAILLERGELERSTDSEGDTLLKNLCDLAESSEYGQALKKEVLGWTITHLAHPRETFAQVQKKGTCAPTTLAMELLCDNPSEFVRVTDGLASKKRSVRLANGETMNRAVKCMTYDAGLGTPVERIVQASFMDFARPDKEYRLANDSFSTESDTGLYPDQVEKLAEALGHQELDLRPLNAAELESALQKSQGTVPVTLRWSNSEKSEVTQGADDAALEVEVEHSNHMVLLTGFDGERVSFHNPWGWYSKGQAGPEGRETSSTGEESLPLDEFMNRMEYAVVPASVQA